MNIFVLLILCSQSVVLFDVFVVQFLQYCKYIDIVFFLELNFYDFIGFSYIFCVDVCRI